MHNFRIFQESNPNVAWLTIEEGNLNIETGIRFMYTLLSYDSTPIDRKLFIINGDDFSNIGLSGKDTRIAIIELLLQTINAIIVQE